MFKKGIFDNVYDTCNLIYLTDCYGSLFSTANF